MNRFTRLTALLLALMMILSTFAAAETAYQVGDMTTEQWNSIVQNAQSILNEPVIDEGGDVIEYPPEQPGESKPYSETVEVTLGANKDITTATLAVVKSNVAGQWQIAIKDDLWVNILGETGSTLNVNAAMLQGTAMKVRQAKNDAQVTAFTLSEATAAAQTFAVENRADSTTTTPSAANDVSSLQDANPNIEQWIVEIKYVFTDSGNTAASSWTGKVAKNAGLYTSAIVLPKVNGYYAASVTTSVDAGSYKFQPQTNTNNNITDGTIQLQINSVTANLVINVNYTPALMDFKVTHVYQDVNGEFPEIPEDGSSIAGSIEVETKSGKTTGTAVGAVAKSVTGFTNLWYDETVKIAADGSTNIIVYYEREWYLMLFDCNGGYNTEPVYARYGAQLNHQAPERPGYSFEGWKLIESNGNAVTDAATIAHSALPSTMPHENRTYQAQWAEGNTTYTVVYWFADLKEGTNPTTYSDVGRKTVTAQSGTVLTPSVVGTDNPATEVVDPATGEKAIVDAPYFTYDEDATTANNETAITVVGDGSTVVNVYYSRNEYTIRYIYARQNGNTHYVANLTGCGSYNGDIGLDHNHGYVWWRNSNTTTSLKETYSDQYGSFREGNYTYHYISLTAEYGADLSDSWPAAPLEPAGDFSFGSWAAQCGSPYRLEYGNEHANIVGIYPTMSAELIVDPSNSIAQTMLAFWARTQGDGVDDHTYHIYFEALPDDEQKEHDKNYNNKRYVLEEDIDFVCAHNGSTRVDPIVYEGFVCINNDEDLQSDSENFGHNEACPYFEAVNDWCTFCNIFYYDRIRYTLSFVNYNAESPAPASKNLMFGQSISSAKPLANPEYPVGLEAGGYKFVAWYTTPECQDGTEVDWNSTMPAGDMTVYAKWVSDDHTIIFYTDEADCTAENPVVYEGPYTLLHNEVFSDTYQGTADLAAIENPTNYKNTNLSFIGWFYKDTDGTEKAWTPKMAVKKDLELYGKWGLTEPVAFTVYFKLKDGTDVADPIVGKTLVDADSGTQNIDLEAKTGYDLFANFQVGVFPITTSHTLVVDVNNTDNTYTFEYVEKEAVPYLVRYLIEDANGSIEIAGKKYSELVDSKVVADNRNAIVTEPYQMVPGYMPDEYQKRLIVTGEESNNWITEGNVQIHPDNVINFIYHVDTANAFYAVEHYIQPVDGSDDRTTWTQVGVADSYTGSINSEVTATLRDIPGFKYDTHIIESYYREEDKDPTIDNSGESLTTTLTDGGVVFKIYYKRNEYPYKVQYLEVDTNAPVQDPREANAYYQAVVTETAAKLIEKNGEQYELVTSESQQLTIQAEKTPTLNVITFFYEKRVPITYIAMTKDANGTIVENNIGGNVDLNDGESNLQPETSEPVRIKTGAALGATAVKNANYKFVGWYNNEACSGTALSTNERYIPEKINGNNVQATYYALFELDVADLTITKEIVNAADSTVAPTDDVFTFQVELPNGEYTYTVDGKESNSKLVVQGGKGELSIKAGEVVAIKDVVINSQYKVSEVNKHDYFKASDPVSGQIAATGNNAKITNTYLTGNLVITKRVTSDKAPDDTFTMNVTLTLPDTTGAELPTSFSVSYSNPTTTGSISSTDGTIQLQAGQSATIVGLPYGTTYEVMEVTPPEYYNDEADYKFSDPGKKIDSKADDTVEVTNTYNTVDLKITKQVTADEGITAPEDTFDITVNLVLPNGLTELPASVTCQLNTTEVLTTGTSVVFAGVKAKDVMQITGLPAGTTYIATETKHPSYYEVSGEVASTTEITDATKDITITNKYLTGSLEITKDVVGEGMPTTDSFAIEVAFMLPDGNATIPTTYTLSEGVSASTQSTTTVDDVKCVTIQFTGVQDNDRIVITGIPYGTTYKVTEETPAAYYTVGYSDNSGGSVDEKTSKPIVTVTNTYNTGSLDVTKEVVGVTAPRDANGKGTDEFSFTLKLTDKDDPTKLINATIICNREINGNGSGIYTFTLKDGETAQFTQLPANVQYTVTETEDENYTTVPTNATGAIVAGANATATVAFVNTYRVGALTITKNVSGASANANDTFVFTVSGPGIVGTLKVVLKGSGSVTIPNLKIGSYMVTEDTNWSWRYTVSNNGQSVAITENDTTSVIFTNVVDNPYWLDGSDYNENNFGNTGN